MKQYRLDNIFRDERGFTTTSMVLSMLITLALVFTGAQVYRINSASSEVQDVADAAALSAQNQVAEFMIIARFCDATVLSLSLTGIATCGLGIVALCVPATAPISKELLEAGKNILKARNDFSDRSKRALDKLQEALPFFAAASAAAVSTANNGDSSGANYVGVSLLVPSKGEPIKADATGKADELTHDIDEKSDSIREHAKEAEEAAKEANEAKKRAFMRDCGDNPNYCMYERAAHLIGLSGSANPLYNSVDTWSFSVALDRAKQYYADRRYNDQPEGDSVEDLARWQLRLHFYRYAFHVISSQGYVHDSGGSFDANFPHLPRNTSEMKETDLYTDASYPITESEGKQVMHAWDGCPGATGGIIAYGSISFQEEAEMEKCPICGFDAVSLGSVAAASTSIDNGFEYHYEAVAREAELYQEARDRASGPRSAVEEEAGSLFDKLLEALKEAADKRIKVAPPGRYGSIAFVVNTGSTPAAGGFSSGFVATGGSLGPRAAISAATLLDEGSDEGRTVLNSMLDGLREDGGAAVGAIGIALDVWSKALSAYADGVNALKDGVRKGIDTLPLASESGLGTWASKKLNGLIDDVGLEPAELKALKPVLVNSAHVAAKDDGAIGSNLMTVKQQIIAHPLYSTDLFSAVLSDAERTALEQVNGLGDSIDIASIELLGDGGPTIPITIPLPPEAKQYGLGAISSLFDRVRSIYASTTGVRVWE